MANGTTNFVPLNRFRSVVTTLNGVEQTLYEAPSGVSTIVLSSQYTNNSNQTQRLTVYLDANTNVVVPQFGAYTNVGNYNDTATYLEANLEFIVAEIIAYINNYNITNPPIIALTPAEYGKDVRRVVNGIIGDLRRGGFTNSTLAVKGFYDNYGTLVTPTTQIGRKIVALGYTDVIIQLILTNSDVTPLYQNDVTQSKDLGLPLSASGAQVATDVLTVASASIVTPVFDRASPIELMSNFPLPAGDSLNPVVAGKTILEEGYTIIASGSSDISVILSLLESANE
jgi:hypothetical protein